MNLDVVSSLNDSIGTLCDAHWCNNVQQHKNKDILHCIVFCVVLHIDLQDCMHVYPH